MIRPPDGIGGDSTFGAGRPAWLGRIGNVRNVVRQEMISRQLDRHLPELEPTGIAAGLHLVAWLPRDLEEATVIAAAAREGVVVAGVSPYRLSPAPRGGLIFGYSNLNERAIADGIMRLARAVSGLREAAATGTTPAPTAL